MLEFKRIKESKGYLERLGIKGILMLPFILIVVGMFLICWCFLFDLVPYLGLRLFGWDKWVSIGVWINGMIVLHYLTRRGVK